MKEKYSDFNISSRPVIIGVCTGFVMIGLTLLVIHLAFTPFTISQKSQANSEKYRENMTDEKIKDEKLTGVTVQVNHRDVFNDNIQINKRSTSSPVSDVQDAKVAEAMKRVQRRYDPGKVDTPGEPR